MQYFGRKSWRKRPLRRPERSGRNMDLREIGCEGVDRMHLAQDRGQCQTLVNMVMNLRVP
jgi:hypothetical protein